MAEQNLAEFSQTLVSSIKEIKDDSEWKGRMSAMMEMMVKGISDIKSEQCRVEEKVEKRIEVIALDVTRLRVKVAGWSAVYASVSSAIMWVLLNMIFRKV